MTRKNRKAKIGLPYSSVQRKIEKVPYMNENDLKEAIKSLVSRLKNSFQPKQKIKLNIGQSFDGKLTPGNLYIVVSGEIRIDLKVGPSNGKQTIFIDQIKADDFFGELEINYLGGKIGKFNSTVKALEDNTEVYEFDEMAVNDIKNDPVSLHIIIERMKLRYSMLTRIFEIKSLAHNNPGDALSKFCAILMLFFSGKIPCITEVGDRNILHKRPNNPVANFIVAEKVLQEWMGTKNKDYYPGLDNFLFCGIKENNNGNLKRYIDGSTNFGMLIYKRNQVNNGKSWQTNNIGKPGLKPDSISKTDYNNYIYHQTNLIRHFINFSSDNFVLSETYKYDEKKKIIDTSKNIDISYRLLYLKLKEKLFQYSLSETHRKFYSTYNQLILNELGLSTIFLTNDLLDLDDLYKKKNKEYIEIFLIDPFALEEQAKKISSWISWSSLGIKLENNTFDGKLSKQLINLFDNAYSLRDRIMGLSKD